MNEPGCVLLATGLTLGRTGHAPAVLEDVSLQLAAGECVHLTGPTGSGKSTLLRALAAQGGVDIRSGRVGRRGDVAMLAQHVELQLLCATVAEEVSLGLELLRLTSDEAERRRRDALAAVGLCGFEHREVDTLSAGEKQRTVLAALLALRPQILLLDEPTSALDAGSRHALCRTLETLKRRGAAIVVVDHATPELAPVFDRRLVIEKGRLVTRHATAPAPAAPSWEAAFGQDDDDARERAERFRGRFVAGMRSGEDRRGLASIEGLPIRAGERVLVTGPNGSGKSTWLRAVAALASGRAHAGRRAAVAAPGEIALVIQEPRRALFCRTVADEVAFTLERRGWRAGRVRARVDDLLSRFELLDCAARSPLRLSFGQQHRLAIAAALAAGPSLALIDEPFAGLDFTAQRALLRVLAAEQRASGTALVVASHDRAPLAHGCDRVIELRAPEAKGG